MPDSKNVIEVQIPRKLHEQVKKVAADNDLSINSVVTLLLDNMVTYSRADIAHSMQAMIARAKSRGVKLYQLHPSSPQEGPVPPGPDMIDTRLLVDAVQHGPDDVARK